MPYLLYEVDDQKMLDRFVDFPYKLYKGNQYWAPPLKNDEKSFLKDIPVLDTRITTSMFIVLNDRGEVVGRIQAIINYHEIEFSGENTGRFNKLDFIDDVKVCGMLLNAAENWLRNLDIDMAIGPFGYSNLDAAGTLVEGFEELSCSSAIYNYPYYEKHILNCGYREYLEWLEHEFDVPVKIPEKIVKYSELIRKRYKLEMAPFYTRADKIKRSRQILELINICYAHLPGFVPLSDELKDFYHKKYMPLVNKDYISLVIDQDDQLVGFGLTVPSYTKALQKANGSIFPFGFYYLWQASRNTDRAEMLLIAIHPDFQQKGIISLIFEQILQKYIENGIKKVESNPEQVNNMNVRNLWKDYDFRLHKKRICFYKKLKEN